MQTTYYLIVILTFSRRQYKNQKGLFYQLSWKKRHNYEIFDFEQVT